MIFGWRSVLLLLGVVQGLVVAGLLLGRTPNRVANRFLALLMIAFVGALIPQTIGFAGAYDRFPWLTFAPFDVSLAFGPLLYLYMRRLLIGPLSGRWWLHLVPGLLQLGYYALLFVQPLAVKARYGASVHAPTVVPIETFAALLSVFAYWFAAAHLFRRYRQWVPQQVSDSENYRLHWLQNLLVALVVTFLFWLLFELAEAMIGPFSYRQGFWFFLWGAGIMYYLGMAGYRHAGLRYPQMPLADPAPAPAASAPAATGDENWAALGEDVARQLNDEAWYLDPALTLPGLARKLNTNTWTLSRAINLGLDTNFNDLVNASRVQRVQAHLADSGEKRPILEIAVACGFNSKTSFNRSFKKLTGLTPSAFRQASRRAES